MMKKNLSGYVVKFLIIWIGSSFAGLTYAQDTKVVAYQTADTELRNIYKQLMDKLSTKDKESLKKSQRLWNAFRNADCGYGSVDKFDCLGSRTNERTQQLKDRLENLPH